MNGRMYDPIIGRMLSPDPYVPNGTYTQDFNRYTYARNNPLSYVDPDGEFVVGFNVGFWRGLFSGKNPFKEGWKTGVNEVKIWGGLFAIDFSRPVSTWGPQLQNRFTRELPQVVAGLVFTHISNYAGQVDKVEYYGGATVSHGNFWGQGDGSAITLGNYITGGRELKANPNNPLFQHEYGHYLQSQAYGWRYLTKIGLPSIKSANNKDPNHKHSHIWAEQDANERAYAYFYRRTRGRVDWDFGENPILNEDWVNQVQNMYSRSSGRNNPTLPMYNPTTIPTISNYMDWQFQGIDGWQHKTGRRRTPPDRLRNLLLLYK